MHSDAGVTPPGSWEVSKSLSLHCPCCPELVFANLSYYLLLSSSSQAWPVPVAQLWWQWLGEDVCWQPGEEMDGTVALEPAVLVALAVCQAGRGHWQCGAHTQLPLCLLKPGCLSFVPGVQLYAVHAPLAALLPFPCSALGTACLSLRQTRKGFYPQPARRVMQIPEAPAPICRAAVSQLSPLLFSVGRKARHCFKLLPVE